MRDRFWKCFVGCIVLFTCCLVWPGLSFAADTASPPRKPDAALMRKVEPVVRAFARQITQEGSLDRGIVFALIANYLWKNPSIYGAAFAFAPEIKDGKEVKSCPYVYRRGDQLVQKDLINSYDYTAPDQKWYVMPVKMGKPVWSEPHFNKGGGETWMSTFSIPVYSGGQDRRLIGVVTSDILIPEQ
jgi:phosphoserine phosphatase RsbU/P